MEDSSFIYRLHKQASYFIILSYFQMNNELKSMNKTLLTSKIQDSILTDGTIESICLKEQVFRGKKA